MNKIPTAEEFSMDIEFLVEYDLVLFDNIYKYAIDFAKLHVKAALENASKKVYADSDDDGNTFIDKESILNAYPLENIK